MGIGIVGVLNNSLLYSSQDPDRAADLILKDFAEDKDVQVLIALIRRIRDEPKSGLRSR